MVSAPLDRLVLLALLLLLLAKKSSQMDRTSTPPNMPVSEYQLSEARTLAFSSTPCSVQPDRVVWGARTVPSPAGRSQGPDFVRSPDAFGVDSWTGRRAAETEAGARGAKSRCAWVGVWACGRVGGRVPMCSVIEVGLATGQCLVVWGDVIGFFLWTSVDTMI